MLAPLSDHIAVRYWRRHEKWACDYASYSQLVNEAVSDVGEEFVFFVNPKVNPKPAHLEEMLAHLCGGYCWSGLVSFGLWGATRELFRHTGLLDERFVGGEYEDNDFICRLKLLGRAIHWEYRLEEYPGIGRSPVGPMRGAAAGFFMLKWRNDGNRVLLRSCFAQAKRLLGEGASAGRPDIRRSWLDSTHSRIIGNHGIGRLYHLEVGVEQASVVTRRCEASVSLQFRDAVWAVRFSCALETVITVVPVNPETGVRLAAEVHVPSNTQTVLRITDVPAHVEVRIFHEGQKVYHNRCARIPFLFNIHLGLEVSQVVPASRG